MLCDYCGNREANVRYSENINGQKREMNLCEQCSHKLGIMNKMDLHMTTDFSNFFGGFLENFEQLDELSLFKETKSNICKSCNTSFDDIVNTGKLGCMDCYDTFSDRLDQILKRIQGANRHIGRIGKIDNSKVHINKVETKKTEKNTQKNNILDDLNEKLKLAIKDERYEEAAKIRDEIKKHSNNEKEDKK